MYTPAAGSFFKCMAAEKRANETDETRFIGSFLIGGFGPQVSVGVKKGVTPTDICSLTV